MGEDREGRFSVPKDIRVEQLIELYSNIIPEVEEDLLKKAISPGLTVPATPEGLDGIVKYGEHGDPAGIEDLTQLSDDALGQAFWYFTEWCNYLQAELSKGKSVLLVLKRNAKVIEAALEIYYKEERGMPANQAANHVTIDERMVDMDANVLRAEVFVEKVRPRYEQLKRVLVNVSREQTRRSEEMNRTTRNENIKKPRTRWARRG